MNEEKFWTFINADGVCWEWQGATNGKGKGRGYGHLYLNGVHWMSHRLSWTLLIGIIPVDLELDHRCRNKICVCPDHLEPVTKKVNINRGAVPHVNGRHNSIKTHCKRNHEFNEVNTYFRKNGSRDCRLCKQLTRTDFYVGR